MATHALKTTMKLIDDKIKMVSQVSGKPDITTDYFPPLGTGDGYTPLELTLISLSTCLSTTLLTILRHGMKKEVKALSATAEGVQREEMPRILTDMRVAIDIDAEDLTREEVDAALKRTEQVCPVWNMLREGLDIDVSYQLNQRS